MRHACLIHADEAARIRHAAGLIRAAVRRDARTLYVGDANDVVATLDDDSLLATGRLVVRSTDDAYVAHGRFDPEAAVARLREEAGRARADGFAGLHVTGPMTWATCGLPGSERLVEFERRLAAELAGLGVEVMCQYDRRRFAPELLERAAASHPTTVRVLPLLDVEHSSDGTVALVGELDLSNADVLRDALLRLTAGRRELVVDLGRLEFLDLAGARALCEAGAALEERAGRLELRSARGPARRLLEASGPLGVSRGTRSRHAVAVAELFRRFRRDGDPAAREALVKRFLPLARQLARRYEHGGEPLEDLVQVASVGLLKAIDRFDPDREVAFSSFAVPTIAGELKRHFRDHGWSVRVPRDLQELSMRVDRATERLTCELGRTPTANDLAEHLGTGVEQVLEARHAAGAHRAESLDRPSDDPDDPPGEAIGAEDAGYGRAEHSATIGRLMRVLGDRDREVLRLRFAEDLTQSEIAARVGLSQMHVSRLIRQSVARLRDAAG